MSRLSDFLKAIKDVKVAKSHLNEYAQKPFMYRNADDILSAFKSPLAEAGFHILCEDVPVIIQNEVYIKVTACVLDCNVADGSSAVILTTSSMARQEMERRGFSPSQLSGSAISYAKKYCLNNLLMLDDGLDSDALKNGEQKKTEPAKKAEQGKAKTTAKGAETAHNQTKKDSEYKCSSCGKAITEKVHTYSSNKFGRALCFVCQKKAGAK